MGLINTNRLTTAHNDWLRGLDFYKEELGILHNRLLEVTGKNTARDILSQGEHFEMQFKIQLTNVDVLRHDINELLSEIAAESKAIACHVSKEHFARHEALHERYITLEKVINDLKHEFYRYATRWM